MLFLSYFLPTDTLIIKFLQMYYIFFKAANIFYVIEKHYLCGHFFYYNILIYNFYPYNNENSFQVFVPVFNWNTRNLQFNG